MSLNKCRLGDFLELLENNNTDLTYGIESVRGVNNLKKMMPTKADLNGRDLSKFQIVNPGEFFFNHRTSRNGSKFSITYNDESDPIICTEDYVVFRIKPECEQVLLADWLYMYFNRSEFDRYVITNSWGSSTEFYNWDDLCDIDIELPSLPVQQKYVDIYKAMVANQQSYECGLEDLKLVCAAYFDKIKVGNHIFLGDVIEKSEAYNTDNRFGVADVKGMTITKEIIPTKANVNDTDLSKFIIVEPNEFVYNPRTHGKRIGLGYNNSEKAFIISWNNIAFRIKSEMSKIVIPQYLYYCFRRDEWDREACYNSWGSSTEVFSWNSLCEMSIPCPTLDNQTAISQIDEIYNKRKQINEKIKVQINNICSILIKGSIKEARKEA